MVDDLQFPEDYYEDDRHCKHCDRTTSHNCRDSGHERDSSGDYQECNVCGYWSTGLSGHQDQSPPFR